MSTPLPENSPYRPSEGLFDEMFDAALEPRRGCHTVVEEIFALTPPKLAELRKRADAMLLRQGVTFNVYGNEEKSERIFPFDPIPRIIDAATWAELESGLKQRVRALNAFIGDIYGDAEILKDGIVPRDMVLSSPQYRYSAIGLKPPLGNFVTVAGIDLVRGEDGRFYVLEDNVRTPSGVSYVLENRLVMTRLLPAMIRSSAVRSVQSYPADLLASLNEIAPGGKSNPTVALLTPGMYNSAFFEHVALAQLMGIELVEGRDLVCVDHKLYMRTVRGLEQIDVVYRRMDDDFLDPVTFRPDSVLGVPGLAAAIRAGNVAIANGIGTGVADDKGIFAYTPAMIRYYLNEEPILPIVETLLLRDPDVRRAVLRDLDRYVVKPIGESGGYGVVIGPKSNYRELSKARDLIERDPKSFIAQPMIQLSVHPTVIGESANGTGPIQPRHVDLRPFVLLGAKPRVLPGGLTRVALREGSLIVNSSQGGGSKDTWVLEG